MTRIECLKALKCPETATPLEIVAAYKKLRKRFHPDTKGTGNETLFIHVTEAYKFLSENFDLDVLMAIKKDKDLDIPGHPSISLKAERQLHDQLKHKLDVLGNVSTLHYEITQALLDKMEFHKDVAECHIILLPEFGSTVSIDLKGTKLRVMVRTERNPELNLHVAYIRFTQDGKKLLPDEEFELSDALFERFLNFLAFQNFYVKFQDFTKLLEAEGMAKHSILGMLASVNPKCSVSDVCAAITILGKREFIVVSECRNVVERYIREIVKKGSHTYIAEAKQFRHIPYDRLEAYVKLKWDKEVYSLLGDGTIYVVQSSYLRPKSLETITDCGILAYFVECFKEAEDIYRDSIDGESLRKLRQKNLDMKNEIDRIQNLANVLGQIKQELLV
jgi:hypothetical protein